jgi:uncharacterized protein
VSSAQDGLQIPHPGGENPSSRSIAHRPPSRRRVPRASFHQPSIAEDGDLVHAQEDHHMPASAPQFRELTVEECHSLLARHDVGRLAFTLHDRVDIEPINYVSDGEWIFGRTSVGTKLATLLHHPWCAFETDDVRGLFDWDSVVAKGTFYLLDPEQGSPDTYMRAQKLLQKLVPGSLSAHDPAPHRNILFGVFINEISGRSARR